MLVLETSGETHAGSTPVKRTTVVKYGAPAVASVRQGVS